MGIEIEIVNNIMGEKVTCKRLDVSGFATGIHCDAFSGTQVLIRSKDDVAGTWYPVGWIDLADQKQVTCTHVEAKEVEEPKEPAKPARKKRSTKKEMEAKKLAEAKEVEVVEDLDEAYTVESDAVSDLDFDEYETEEEEPPQGNIDISTLRKAILLYSQKHGKKKAFAEIYKFPNKELPAQKASALIELGQKDMNALYKVIS